MVAAAYDGGWEILEDSLRRLTNGCIIFLKRSTKELLFLMIFGQIGKVERSWHHCSRKDESNYLMLLNK